MPGSLESLKRTRSSEPGPSIPEFHRDSDDEVARDSLVHASWWYRYRQTFKEPAAEFFGTALLVLIGVGVNCQVVLSSNPDVVSSERGSWLSVSIGWAIGVAAGVWASAGVSGGHINPAVTLALAVWRGFSWKKVPVYIAAQLLGGIVGAALVYANYYHAINIFEGGTGIRTLKTAGLFGTFPLDYMSNGSSFFSEVLATALLLTGILVLTDKRNAAPPLGLLPLGLFFFVTIIGAGFGMETSFAINPARDLGPRILTAMVGYGGSVFSFRNQYWLWCPILAPILGAQLATFLYDLLVYVGDDSLIYKFTT